ncbi:MAG: DUF1015 domain-containing protein [Deltaproteobacteria bacterium]|nr:DUF1015 domain-containing protein [Deltaproteobacteria bacterium]
MKNSPAGRTGPAVSPFRGLLYNRKKIRKMEKVVAPPYDVISPSYRSELYKRDRHNVVRLILPSGADPYSAAARTFQQWCHDDILTQNGKPSFYLYHQTFMIHGRKFVRKGIMGIRRLEPWGRSILPHERTLAAPKRDRLRLLRECQANLSPVFSLYSDPSRQCEKWFSKMREKPLFDLTTEDGIRHQFWSISDPEQVKKVSSLLSRKTLYIADGHHRYETALAYSKEEKGRKGADSVMMFFSNLNDPGLVVLPTHRLYHSPIVWDWKKITRRAGKVFTIKTYSVTQKKLFLAAFQKSSKIKLGVILGKKVAGSGPAFALFETSAQKFRGSSLAKGLAPHRLVLGSSLLHDLFVPRVLGIKGARASLEENFTFEKEIEDVLKKVSRGEATAGFLLPSPKVSDVVSICERGEVLPQKTTFFYPKLLSGLVFHKF